MGPQKRLALPVLALAAASACSFPEPPESLRNVMLKQEIELLELERQAGEGVPEAELVPRAGEIRALSESEAFERYAARPDVAPRAAEFRALWKAYVGATDDVVAAAGDGGEALRDALSRLRASCDGCHAQFRPGIPLRR